MRSRKTGVTAWVTTVLVLLAAGSAVALLRGGTPAELPQGRAVTQSGPTGGFARQARGRSAVLAAPPGWSPGRP